MQTIKDFFIELGFSFDEHLVSKKIKFEHNEGLTKKLKEASFFYNNPNQTNTSFYLFSVALNSDEFEAVRKYVWNESIASVIFYVKDKEASQLTLFYSKASPKTEYQKCVLDKFSTSEKDVAKINNIKRWTFDSGTFWVNYHSFLKKAKFKGVDKELISTLTALKEGLNTSISKIERDVDKKDEIVQALIDRTLYIKYLEDNHIINSYFYKFYFNDEAASYKTLLLSEEASELNKLFDIIHNIFNNSLFEKPEIESVYLTSEVCSLVYSSLKSDLKTGQLRLFDFQFDIIPVEFISYIYEIFLTEKQKENGIYYTPKKLAQLIVDDVIPEGKTGSVLDPSCGSGMFLIVAFQKLLENNPERKFKTVEQKIVHRTRLLAENIYGIEKEVTAQRFTLFSLSLQLFRDLDLAEIKKLIEQQLKEHEEVTLFKKHSFFQNIQHANTLSQLKPPFEERSFDYIVGNPPFFEIKDAPEFNNEIKFIREKEIKFDGKKQKARDIVGKHQISQCFLMKIKDWGHEKTRFGFVSNSSNFYNDNSKEFQKYFYSEYRIEKIYELSRVKKILFENATESVVSLIFSNNQNTENFIEYYPVDMGVFSEKPFELLIIQEDKIVTVEQELLRSEKQKLRDFLLGNEYDRTLIEKIESESTLLDKYILKTKDSVRGIQIWGEEAAGKEFGITESAWKTLTKEEKEVYRDKFLAKYVNDKKTDEYQISLYKPRNLSPFKLLNADQFVSDISNFDKTRTEQVFLGEKILWNRIGKLKAVYSSYHVYFDFDIYSIKLNTPSLYFLITALLNSKLASYYIENSLRKRVGSSFPKIGAKDITKLPIPRELDMHFVNEISEVSKNLSLNQIGYTAEVEEQLNDLIFDLYDLSYWEKQRIKDYFLPKAKPSNSKGELEKYREAIESTIDFYLANPITVEFSKTDFDLRVAKISLNGGSNTTPTAQKVQSFTLNEIFEANPNENFLASQEKIYGEDCVYILKKDINLNWTKTKAYEDGQEILKHILPNG